MTILLTLGQIASGNPALGNNRHLSKISGDVVDKSVLFLSEGVTFPLKG